MAVDAGHHVITHIYADFANKNDNQCLQDMTLKLKDRLNSLSIEWENMAADTGYSSGENYAFLLKAISHHMELIKEDLKDLLTIEKQITGFAEITKR